LVQEPEERRLEEVGVDGRIILRVILKEQRECGLD
jgi:hypothetical protein